MCSCLNGTSKNTRAMRRMLLEDVVLHLWKSVRSFFVICIKLAKRHNSVGKLTNTAAQCMSSGVKLRRWWLFLRSKYRRIPTSSPYFFTHNHTTNTLTHTPHRECLSGGHYLSKVSRALIATATKVCHATLSNPVLFHSIPLPFPFHGQSSVCPFYSPGQVHHPHHLSEWYRERRSPNLGFNSNKRAGEKMYHFHL